MEKVKLPRIPQDRVTDADRISVMRQLSENRTKKVQAAQQRAAGGQTPESVAHPYLQSDPNAPGRHSAPAPATPSNDMPAPVPDVPAPITEQRGGGDGKDMNVSDAFDSSDKQSMGGLLDQALARQEKMREQTEAQKMEERRRAIKETDVSRVDGLMDQFLQ